MAKQLALPRSIWKYRNIIGRHQGEERTYAAVQQLYYWANMYQDTKIYSESYACLQLTFLHLKTIAP